MFVRTICLFERLALVPVLILPCSWKRDGGRSLHSWLPIGTFTPSTLPYLVPALSAPALNTPGHLVQITFTPEYFSLSEDYANEPLTSLSLLLLWVYWQAANNFTAYTATRSPRPEVAGRKSPELGTGFSRSCWDSQQLLLKPSE